MLKILISGIGAWVVAQAIKISLFFIKNKKISFNDLQKAGGMPSAQSACVSALTLSVYLYEGLTSLFAVTFILSILVLRDTMIREDSKSHNVYEIIAGVILGLVLAYFVFII